MKSELRAEVDAIKERCDMADLLARYGYPSARDTGKYLVLRCPFHVEDTPSFYVHKGANTWKCWGAGCGRDGDVIDFVGLHRFGVGAWDARNAAMFRAVLEDLSGGRLPPAQFAIPRTWRDRRLWREVELTPETQVYLYLAASVYHTTLLRLGRGPGTPHAYLRSRDFSDETIRRELLGYAPGGTLLPALRAAGLAPERAAELHLVNARCREFMAGRIVFVERDRTGRVLHLSGRKFAPWLGAEAAKYLSLREMTKPLYGWGVLDRRESREPVVLVESPPDRLTAVQWGFDALANTGTGLKREHAVELRRLKRPLVIVPHNDRKTRADGTVCHPGWEAADAWLEAIGHGTAAALPEKVKDLNELGQQGEAGRAEFLKLMRALGYEARRRPAEAPARRFDNMQEELWGRSLLSSHF